MKTLIALAILILYGAAIWYVRHDDPPQRIDPRAYHCGPDSGLVCPEPR